VIVDTAAAISSLPDAEWGSLKDNRVVSIDVTDDALALRSARIEALGGIVFTAGDRVTLRDAQANLQVLSADQIRGLNEKGVDVIDSTDDVLRLSNDFTNAFLATNLSFADDDLVTADTGKLGFGFFPEEITLLSDKGVDIIDYNGQGLYPFDVDRAKALAASNIRFGSNNDNVILSSAGAGIATLSAEELTRLSEKGVDFINASNDLLSLALSQFNALGSIALNADDVVMLEVTRPELGELDEGEIAGIKTKGIDTLSLSASSQFLSALSVQEIAALEAKGVNVLNASEDVLALSLAQVNALGGMRLAASDAVTLSVSSTEANALTSTQISDAKAKGVDLVVLKDGGQSLRAFTAGQISALSAKGVNVLDATDNALTLSADQYSALGAMRLTASDTVTLSDSGGKLSALTSAQISALAGKGIDTLDAADQAYTLSLAQYLALGAVKLSGNDVVTVGADANASLSNGGNHRTLTGNAISGTGNSLANTITGNGKNNILSGLEGNDALYGGLGNDQLRGGGNKDVFVFDTRLNKNTNVDKIYDFKSRDDSFHLDNKVFTKLGSGTASRPKKFSSDMFVEGKKAQDREDRIVYDKKTGALYYDQDGTGSKAQVKIATITTKAKLYYHDFFVI
jgi:Ca2+-binding RTX toxin-like protein